MPDVRNDEPINSVVNDLFGFSFQASVIAKLVGGKGSQNHLSVGVSGSWGSGKTSLLNMVRELLEYKKHEENFNILKRKLGKNKIKNISTLRKMVPFYRLRNKIEKKEHLKDLPSSLKDVQVIWFDPWFFGTEETVIKAFFYRIAKELVDEDRELSKLFLKLAVVMSSIPELPDSLPVVGNALKVINYGRNLLSWMSGDDGSVMDFTDIKRKICDRLKSNEFTYVDDEDDTIKKTRKRIVIIIDDLDRLQVDEALTMLKVIRLVTEFGINFVIGYDEETLSATIDKNCGGHGREYIKKMINVPTYQPSWEIDETNKENYFDNILWNKDIKETIFNTFWQRYYNSDVQQVSIETNDDSFQIKDKYYQELYNIINKNVKTPRQLINLGNIYINGYNTLKPRVDPSDYLLLCILKLYYPKLFTKLMLFEIPFKDNNTDDLAYINDEEKFSIEETEIKNVQDNKKGEVFVTVKADNPNKQKQLSQKKIKNEQYYSIFDNEEQEKMATELINIILMNNNQNALKKITNRKYYFSLLSPTSNQMKFVPSTIIKGFGKWLIK